MTSPAVLIVDDDRDFLDVARAIFEEASPPLAVRTATTGTQALALLARDDTPRPEFIVLDMRLPDMTAADVLREGTAHMRGVPVLVLTQALWRADETAVRHAGARDIHEKPGKLALLRTLLLDFVARRRAAVAPRTE